ncbi:hypothetical protein [Paenibacillus sp.]|uniref:hypothetical protein n=1 Tax=Paenibacillus sp. TaxID=58172 RepID=UPI002D33444E|nr:hypothetical protein [Paenibacillus sp.]HZG87284.1 hypothetical protein [Paenibacillus sp.]
MRWYVPAAIALLVGLGTAGNAAAAERPDEHGGHHRAQVRVMASPTHHAMYMQLLAEKYAPDTVEAWKQTMDERVALMGEMRELKQQSREWKQDEAKAKMERFAKESGEAMKKRKALFEEFTKAVEAEDGAAIKSLLPKLLASEQQLNAALRKWVDQEKQAKSS